MWRDSSNHSSDSPRAAPARRRAWALGSSPQNGRRRTLRARITAHARPAGVLRGREVSPPQRPRRERHARSWTRHTLSPRDFALSQHVHPASVRTTACASVITLGGLEHRWNTSLVGRGVQRSSWECRSVVGCRSCLQMRLPNPAVSGVCCPGVRGRLVERPLRPGGVWWLRTSLRAIATRTRCCRRVFVSGCPTIIPAWFVLDAVEVIDPARPMRITARTAGVGQRTSRR